MFGCGSISGWIWRYVLPRDEVENKISPNIPKEFLQPRKTRMGWGKKRYIRRSSVVRSADEDMLRACCCCWGLLWGGPESYVCP